MLGVILCTHSTFADGLKNAIEMIAGPQTNFDSICFMNGEDPSDLQERINQAALPYIENKLPYCIIADLYAATPFNVAMTHSIDTGAIVVSGANLPFLLEVLISREMQEMDDVKTFLNNCLENAKDSMKVVDAKAMFDEQ